MGLPGRLDPSHKTDERETTRQGQGRRGARRGLEFSGMRGIVRRNLRNS